MEVKKSVDNLAAGFPLRVIEIDPRIDHRWEAFVASVPDSPSAIYHPEWHKVQEDVFGYEPIYLVCEDSNNQVVGVLPLFHRRRWHSGRSYTSVFIGPLAADDLAKAALLQAAIDRAHAEPGAHLQLKIMSNPIDGLVNGAVGVPAYKTYLLALPEQPGLLHLDSSIKRAINKATRAGVQVRQAQTERELREWYGLYVQTMRKFVVLPNPYRYYNVAWQRLHSKGLLRLLLAEHVEGGQRRLLGGILILLYGQTVSFVSAGWREEDQALRPNDVLHWQAIQDASAEGFRWYDFGDVELGNHGLARYKSKWGAEAKMVYNYSYPVPKDGGIDVLQDQPTYSARRLASSIWKRLPVKAIGLLSSGYHALHI